MELMGKCEEAGYTVEVYFPPSQAPDQWTIRVIKDGEVVCQLDAILAVGSVYGMDTITMKALEAAADDAVAVAVRRRESASNEVLRSASEIRWRDTGRFPRG